MQILSVRPGSKITIGRPADPISKSTIEAVARVLASHREVVEAHLPRVYIEECMDQPAPVLVLAIKTESDIPYIIRGIADDINRVISIGDHLAIWPTNTDDDVFDLVRKAGCQIYRGGGSNPWWAFWKRAA